mgnify:CR=1 FL=1
MARIVSVNRAAPLLAFVTWNARPSQDAGSSSFSFSSRLPCLTSSPSFNPSFFAVDIRLPAVCWGVRAGLIFPCHICRFIILNHLIAIVDEKRLGPLAKPVLQHKSHHPLNLLRRHAAPTFCFHSSSGIGSGSSALSGQ